MNITLIGAALFVVLVGTTLLGRRVHRYLPEDHLSADSRDAVKLAMGLVATMTALVLGLLVSSAKGTYDTARNEVIQMAAKFAFLDRVLALYGPETMETRGELRAAVAEAVGAFGRLTEAGLASWRRTTRVTRSISLSNECRRTMMRNVHLRRKCDPYGGSG